MSWTLQVAEAERGRTVGPSSLVKSFPCDAFHAAGAARNAGANHYRARLALPPRGWPANIEMHRHQFFADFEFVPVNNTMEHREIGRERTRETPVAFTSFHGRASRNLSRRRISARRQAGGRRLAAQQQATSAPIGTGEVLVYTYELRSLRFLGRADGLWRVDTTHLWR